MTRFILAATLVSSALAQSVPLTSETFTYPNLPYQVEPQAIGRGPQAGYNICNSTTEGPESQCQTSFVNNLADFCLWAPPQPNSTIADTEALEVAWCSKPGHGTRIIPYGAITGAQFMRTPGYIQVVGHINQSMINIYSGDDGGELDPHGDDEEGNPLGGLIFTNALSGSNSTFTQIIEWHNFMGSNMFCIKACDPAGANAASLCQHTLDRIGCQYNAPAAYVDGVFESCLGDNQDPPGVYTGADGIVSTFAQPPEPTVPVPPYTPKIPASSSCTTYQSTDLYGAAPSTASSSSKPTSTNSSNSNSNNGSNSGSSPNKSSSNGAAQFAAVGLAGSTIVTLAVVFLSLL